MPTRIHETELTRGPTVLAECIPEHRPRGRRFGFRSSCDRSSAQARGGVARHLRHGGQRGPGAVEQESPDLILTDLIMPDMDGLELVQQVRGRFPSIPMVLMTAFGSEEAAMRALRAGAANYIPKKDLARTSSRPSNRSSRSRPSIAIAASSCAAWITGNRCSISATAPNRSPA